MLNFSETKNMALATKAQKCSEIFSLCFISVKHKKHEERKNETNFIRIQNPLQLKFIQLKLWHSEFWFFANTSISRRCKNYDQKSHCRDKFIETNSPKRFEKLKNEI